MPLLWTVWGGPQGKTSTHSPCHSLKLLLHPWMEGLFERSPSRATPVGRAHSVPKHSRSSTEEIPRFLWQWWWQFPSWGRGMTGKITGSTSHSCREGEAGQPAKGEQERYREAWMLGGVLVGIQEPGHSGTVFKSKAASWSFLNKSKEKKCSVSLKRHFLDILTRMAC